MQEKIKQQLSVLLVVSVLAAMALILIGGLSFLAEHGQETLNLQTFSPITYSFGTLSAFTLIEIGFLILVAAQILRVLFLGYYFWRASEYWLALSSFFIFAVLTYSMLWHE